MPSPPLHDPFSPSDAAPFSRVSPPNLPPTMPLSMKKARLSTGVRLVLGSALVALLSLGAWIALQVFLAAPPKTTFTLPAIPPAAPAPSESPAATDSAANSSPAPTGSVTAPAPANESATNEEATAIAGMRRELSESEDSDAAAYLRAASRISEQGLEPAATQILRDGMGRYPGDEALTIALADQLFATGKPAEAWELIARSGRLSDPRFAARLLQFSLDAGRADETLVILASEHDTLPDWSGAEWLTIVRLHEETGQLDRAIEIADRRVGDRAELFRLRAIRAEKSGKLDEAIFNREQYLAHLADPPPLEWNKLADLYTSAGRVEEAARALSEAAETVARSDTAAP
jgi:tetratricopeptide (TPR) repeat protein